MLLRGKGEGVEEKGIRDKIKKMRLLKEIVA
jgi:hypothetical protein